MSDLGLFVVQNKYVQSCRIMDYSCKYSLLFELCDLKKKEKEEEEKKNVNKTLSPIPGHTFMIDAIGTMPIPIY